MRKTLAVRVLSPVYGGPMSLAALILAIPLAAVACALLASRHRSVAFAICVASVVAITLSMASALWYGQTVWSVGTDPVVGIVLYASAPLVAFGALAGAVWGLRRARSDSGERLHAGGKWALAATALLLPCLTVAASIIAFMAPAWMSLGHIPSVY